MCIHFYTNRWSPGIYSVYWDSLLLADFNEDYSRAGIPLNDGCYGINGFEWGSATFVGLPMTNHRRFCQIKNCYTRKMMKQTHFLFLAHHLPKPCFGGQRYYNFIDIHVYTWTVKIRGPTYFMGWIYGLYSDNVIVLADAVACRAVNMLERVEWHPCLVPQCSVKTLWSKTISEYGVIQDLNEWLFKTKLLQYSKKVPVKSVRCFFWHPVMPWLYAACFFWIYSFEWIGGVCYLGSVCHWWSLFGLGELDVQLLIPFCWLVLYWWF